MLADVKYSLGMILEIKKNAAQNSGSLLNTLTRRFYFFIYHFHNMHITDVVTNGHLAKWPMD